MKKNAIDNEPYRQHLLDLQRNNHFQEDLKNLFKIESEKELFSMSRKMAVDYGLPPVLLDVLVENYAKRIPYIFESVNVCYLIDRREEYLKSKKINPAFKKTVEKETELDYIANPVSLSINKFASKRAILDFIENNWSAIVKILNKYKNNQPRFRSRVNIRDIDDFIYANRNLPLKVISSKLKKEFPDSNIGYEEIGKRKSLEKKRRNRKLNVGR